MKNELEILKKNRKLSLAIIDNFSIDQLNKIPEKLTNNIVWNIAHMVVTQQLLCYNYSCLKMAIPNKMVEMYRKGTFPRKKITEAEFKIFKELYIELPELLESDYEKGIFKKYQKYTTSSDVTIVDIDFAIKFNNFHEGIHLGIILGLRKLI
jgi:hypothetical protein